ncbi:MAG: creatininase family protein [Acidimicrobiia bacterium]
MVELAGLTWEDAGEALRNARLGLVPVGSCEQHGPHLALDTDLAIADALSRRLANDLGDSAILYPPVAYGLSEHHMGFPGTVTLRPETFIGVFMDLVDSAARWGLRRLLIVNGHGGNIDALRLVSRIARRDRRVLVASVMWAQLAAEEIAARAQSPQYGHACEIETSVALVLAPDRVFSERIAAPKGRRSADPLTDPPWAQVDQAVAFDEWTEDGALGDPTLAKPELGAEIVEAAYDRALSFAQRFAHRPLPDGEEASDG